VSQSPTVVTTVVTKGKYIIIILLYIWE
jgi:hypothetical protein